MRKVAVVTGGNAGIGFAITKLLCKSFPGDVILTARNEQRGQKAVSELSALGLSPKFHILDITDKDSIRVLAKHLLDSYGGLDVLVNNAGISFREVLADMERRKDEITQDEIDKNTAMIAEQTVGTNFFALLDVYEMLTPILRKGARVVDLSSRGTKRVLAVAPQHIKERALAEGLTVEDIKQFMQEYVLGCADGSYAEKGWPNNAYGVSKLGVTMLTAIQQKNIDPDGMKDIAVNSCCPGMVQTYMSGWKGVTPEEGADTPVYLALLPPKTEIRGMFLGDRKPVDLYSFDKAKMAEHKVMADIPTASAAKN